MFDVSPMTANVIIIAVAFLLYVFAWIWAGQLPRAAAIFGRILLALVLIAPVVLALMTAESGPKRRPMVVDAPSPQTRPANQEAAKPPAESAAAEAKRMADAKAVADAKASAERAAAEAAQRAAAEADARRRADADAAAQRAATEAERRAREQVATARPPATVPPPAAAAPPPAAGSAPPPPVVTAPALPPPAASRSVAGAPPPAPVTRAPAPAPAPADAQQSDWTSVPVFFGTNRARKDDPKRLSYGANRTSRLELGRAIVTVPKEHQVPNLERPWSIRIPFFDIKLYEQAEDPKKHFTIKEIGALSEEQWLVFVKERLQLASRFKDHAFVFVHGYNNDFDYAVYRTAQIAYDLNFDAAPFMYSWPSGGGVSSYVYDRESAEGSEPHLKAFMELVINKTGAKHVSVIAHSMGNIPLLRVLNQLRPALPAGVQLNQIIMAAPDVDKNLFETLARDLASISKGVTLYASSNDRAMSASRQVAGGVPRAGDVPPEGPLIMKGIDTIDITASSTDWLALNHSTYAERSALIKDITALIETGQRPPEVRFPVLQRQQTPNGDYWRVPPGQ